MLPSSLRITPNYSRTGTPVVVPKKEQSVMSLEPTNPNPPPISLIHKNAKKKIIDFPYDNLLSSYSQIYSKPDVNRKIYSYSNSGSFPTGLNPKTPIRKGGRRTRRRRRRRTRGRKTRKK